MRLFAPALPLALLTLGAATASVANEPLAIRPGLWENRVSMKTQTGQYEAAFAELQRQMASLPPEQRKLLEQQLGQRGMSAGNLNERTMSLCITPEQASLERLPQEPGCTQTVTRMGDKALKVNFTCKAQGDTPPARGEGTVTLSSPTAYQGRYTLQTTIEGKPEQIDMVQSGKWLADSCGAIKPLR